MDEPDIATVAMLIGEPERAAMLLALLDGRSLPAGDLSHHAGILPQTASAHLSKLAGANLLAVERSGRHRYYRLAGPEVGHAIEALGELAPSTPSPGRMTVEPFRDARTCYDHMAGKLGVAVADRLLAIGALEETDREFHISDFGAVWLTDFGVDLGKARAARRPLMRHCLDRCERRPHVAGALGAALLDQFLRRGWVVRISESRVLRVTETGRDGLRRHFDLRL